MGDPLILLYSTVVVCIEIDDAVTLIERIHFYIKARRVYMGAKDVHSLFHISLSNVVEGDGLSVFHNIDLVSRRECRD